MLGAIIGDIAGSYYEVLEVEGLKSNPDKKRSYEERIKILDKKTPLFTEESSYTDDTVLTVAVAMSLISGTSFNDELRKYGLSEISLGKDKYGRSRFGKNFVSWLQDNKVGESYGNGGAMRISPVGLFYDNIDYILRKSAEATIPSHNNEEAIIGAQAVASTIFLARKGFSKEQIADYLESKFGYFMNYSLEELQKEYQFSSRTSESVPEAIFCFLESDSFEDCLRKSLSIGGDSDTIAAIASSIAESYYGIPEEIKKQALSYLPTKYKKVLDDFYNKLKLKEALELGSINDDFWDYMRNHTKVYDLPNEREIWGCFIDRGDNNIITGVKIIVPRIVDQQTLLINIHEYTHAYEYYKKIGEPYIEDVENQEQIATRKENSYLKKVYRNND